MSAENIKIKEAVVSELVEKIKSAKSVVLVDYRGINVSDDTAMRSELRKADVEYKVVKNRIMLRAMNEAGFTGFDATLEGPTAVAFSFEDAVAPARIIVDNVKKTNKISVKAGLVEGRTMDAAGVTALASIPPKPQLVGQLLGMLTSPMRSLAVALSEIAKKKEA